MFARGIEMYLLQHRPKIDDFAQGFTGINTDFNGIGVFLFPNQNH